jgi:hypothetical protein
MKERTRYQITNTVQQIQKLFEAVEFLAYGYMEGDSKSERDLFMETLIQAYENEGATLVSDLLLHLKIGLDDKGEYRLSPPKKRKHK